MIMQKRVDIFLNSYYIPQRLYGQWSFRTLDIQVARMEGYDNNESADKIVIDLLTQLLKLGNTLAKTPKVINHFIIKN